jgi:putative transposase
MGVLIIIYKTIFVPLKCNNKDFEYIHLLNGISAQVWNYCIKIDEEYTSQNKIGMTLSQLEFETKQKFPLHAKGIHHIVFKYYRARNAMWASRKANHKNSKQVKLPYKEKKYMPTGWDSQSIHPEYKNNKIRLTSLKGIRQVICHVKNIPENIVEIELIYKDKYYLAIKYKKENNIIRTELNNQTSIDLGEIHAITSIDKLGNCIIITNRKIRSLVRLKDKRQAELLSLRSRCKEGSNRSKKYTKAIYKIRYKYDRKINDAIHKMTRMYLNWCVENKVSRIYYGDLDTTTRDSKGKLSEYMNHKLNMWRFGEIIEKLTYKSNNVGIELVKISEAYSSQTCPACDKRHKPKSRNYICKCGYSQHRDIVGAINILNWYTNSKITKYTKKVYLQIA